MTFMWGEFWSREGSGGKVFGGNSMWVRVGQVMSDVGGSCD